MGRGAPFSSTPLKWLLVYNVSGEEIPPYAAMSTLGEDEDGNVGVDNQGRYLVTKPSYNGQVENLLFNSEASILPDMEGQGRIDYPVIASYDTDLFEDPPAAGDLLGTVEGVWELQEGCRGFVCRGGSTQDGYTNVEPEIGYTLTTSNLALQGTLSDGTTTVPLYNVLDLLKVFAQRHRAVPETLTQATRMIVPLGPPCARGIVCMRNTDFANLLVTNVNLNADLHLQFTTPNTDVEDDSEPNPDPADTVDFYRLVCITEPLNVTMGYLTDPTNPDSLDEVVLIELADQRWLVDNPNYTVLIDAQYNVRAGAYVGVQVGDTVTNQDPERYYADSLSGGSTVWTWNTMVEDIWNTMSGYLGTYPGLPDGVPGDDLRPEGWVYQGVSAWKALCEVLTKLGCAVKADLSLASNQYSIVQVGDDDTALDDALTEAEEDDRLIHDGQYQPTARAITPGKVRVFFRRLDQGGVERTTPNDNTQWQTRSEHHIDVASGVSGTDAGIIHPLWDDLPAIYDAANTLTNSADLTTRADSRAADYFRLSSATGGGRLWKHYSGLLNITAGSTLKSVAWVGNTEGVYTEIIQHPFLYPQKGQ